ncbi:hypothetical protein [Methanoculleus sp. 10]|uniref:hypothetical protein n=1 Tax=Methanoculleus sp. 10 TaxID=430615 RepID=UPI0025F042DA|nr:hypothetical protein [Methanoculleus sp. 10]
MDQISEPILRTYLPACILGVMILLIAAAGCMNTASAGGDSISGSVAGDYAGGTIYVAAIDAAAYTVSEIRVMETRERPERSQYVSGFVALDAPGEYVISGLAPGNYTIYAWADTDDNGRIDHLDYRDPTGWYCTPSHLTPVKVAVTPGGPATGIDVTLIAPTPYPGGDTNVTVGSGGGRLTVIDGCRVLQLWGMPDERAYAYGYLCGPQIRDWIDYVLIESFMQSPADYEELFIPYIREHMAPANPAYMAELDVMLSGMAAGGTDLYLSSVSRNLTRYDLLAENTYDFMLYYKLYGLMMGDLGINRTATGDAGVSPHLCTSAIAWGNLTANDELAGGVIHGKNMDGENDLRKVTVNSLLVIAVDPGPGAKRMVGIDWPGFIGTFNGMNEDGLVLVPHSSPSIPDWNATDLVPTTFLYRDTLQSESDVAGAWTYWERANGTRVGGHNAGVSSPYRNGTGSVPAAFETDSYGGAVRGPGVVEPDDCLLIANNYYLYQGAYPPAVERVDGYHAAVRPTDYRYRNMLALLDSYREEGRTVGTPEMIALMQSASVSEDYRGTTEYTFIAYPDAGAFAVAKEDLAKGILDAPFAEFAHFEFDEVFERPFPE